MAGEIFIKEALRELDSALELINVVNGNEDIKHGLKTSLTRVKGYLKQIKI